MASFTGIHSLRTSKSQLSLIPIVRPQSLSHFNPTMIVSSKAEIQKGMFFKLLPNGDLHAHSWGSSGIWTHKILQKICLPLSLFLVSFPYHYPQVSTPQSTPNLRIITPCYTDVCGSLGQGWCQDDLRAFATILVVLWLLVTSLFFLFIVLSLQWRNKEIGATAVYLIPCGKRLCLCYYQISSLGKFRDVPTSLCEWFL